MKDNDLSSHPVPRIALVFEGALAWLPDDNSVQRDFGRAVKRSRWDEAAAMFLFNDKMETVIWDRAWRLSMTIDVITYLGPGEWAKAVEARIREEELPVHQVWATTPQLLGRKLSYAYDLVRVYDPFEQHQLMFGAKGRYLTNPNQLGY